MDETKIMLGIVESGEVRQLKYFGATFYKYGYGYEWEEYKYRS